MQINITLFSEKEQGRLLEQGHFILLGLILYILSHYILIDQHHTISFQILKKYRVECLQDNLKLKKSITYTPVEPLKLRFIDRS